MIRRIEALNYRCLRYIDTKLDDFHVLVGPNATGKTTFLDVVAFLGLLVSDGVEAAVNERTQNFFDLVWGRKGNRFELAIEAAIPEEHQTPLDSPLYDRIRYEVAIGLDEETQELRIFDEQILLGKEKRCDSGKRKKPSASPPTTILQEKDDRGWKRLIGRYRKKEWDVSPEQPTDDQGEAVSEDYNIVLRPNPRKTVFAGLNEGEFPASMWLADQLARGIHRIALSSAKLLQPSPPGKGLTLKEDGSNLPWVVTELETKAPEQYADWLAHLQTALPDLKRVRVVERPEDKHRYLMMQYKGGLEVPSWMVSDGTLRLMALTMLAYVPDFRAICLVEEPENSIHPTNIETVMQSMQSVYDGQMLVATHSPILLGVVDPKAILVFSRNERRGTRIVRGSEHPGLTDWRGEVSLGTLFAGGVLG